MNKKIVIAFLVVILLASLFLYFRGQKKTHVANSDRIEAFEKLSAVTKRVPRAGLTQMGMAINKYYEKNKAYPADLIDLYPEYIPLESFIDEIDWVYEPQEDDFYLSKSIKRGKMKLTAFIDKELAPAMGAIGTIASVDRASPQPIPSIEEEETLSTAIMPLIRRIEPLYDAAEMPVSIIERPEIVSITEGEIGLGVLPETVKTVFVWRDANGTLGFGNTMYPERLELSIYENNAWIDIKSPLPRERDVEKSGIKHAGAKKDPDEIAEKHSRKYLVWKDKNGIIGYGNVQGPKSENVSSIYANGSWIDVQKTMQKSREPSAPASKEAVKTENVEERASAEEIAARYSGKYLIWKDKNGVIGYGNVQGPRGENISAICVEGHWIDMDTAFPQRRQTIQAVLETVVEKESADDIVSRYSGKYLIWKDKNGVIGYGNVQAPGFDSMSAIFVSGEWIDIDAPFPLKQQSSRSAVLTGEEEIDLEKVASDYSNTYLIWKSKNGAIGYGNVQYPEKKEIEYICVNGSWQKVAH